MLLRKMRESRWREHKGSKGVNGVQLIVGKQEVGYVFQSEDGHYWTGFVNALYHKRDYPNLKMATEDVEKRWNEFVDRISEPVSQN